MASDDKPSIDVRAFIGLTVPHKGQLQQIGRLYVRLKGPTLRQFIQVNRLINVHPIRVVIEPHVDPTQTDAQGRGIRGIILRVATANTDHSTARVFSWSSDRDELFTNWRADEATFISQIDSALGWATVEVSGRFTSTGAMFIPYPTPDLRRPPKRPDYQKRLAKKAVSQMDAVKKLDAERAAGVPYSPPYHGMVPPNHVSPRAPIAPMPRPPFAPPPPAALYEPMPVMPDPARMVAAEVRQKMIAALEDLRVGMDQKDLRRISQKIQAYLAIWPVSR
jgi:hypothetical protein